MSTIEQTEQSIPTGTWQADTVHSRVAFEVPYAVATFSGEVPDFEATLVDGQLTGVAQDREHPGQGGEPPGPPALARVLRRRAPSRGDLRLERASQRDGDAVEIDGRDHDQGHHAARDAHRHDRPARRSTTSATTRARPHARRRRSTAPSSTSTGTCRSRTASRRSQNEVTLKADLTLVAQEA